MIVGWIPYKLRALLLVLGLLHPLGRNTTHTQSKTAWAITLAPTLILGIFLEFLSMPRVLNRSPTLDPGLARIWVQIPEPITLAPYVENSISYPLQKGWSILHTSYVLGFCQILAYTGSFF